MNVRHGNRTGFWDGVTTYNSSTNLNGGVGVASNNSSAAQQIGREANSLAIYLKVTGAPAYITVWQIQGAHSGGMNVGGEPVDQDTNTLDWHDVWYYGMVPTSASYGTQGATNYQFWIPSGGGAIVNQTPDWIPNWIRITRVDTNGGPVTVQAGWEAQSE